MTMVRIDVKREMLTWAIERAGGEDRGLVERIPQLQDWLNGTTKPTLKQLEKFAKAARVSVGYLFLARPPVDALPIPDLRTMGSKQLHRPSPDLLDTIYLCQRRQEWYREHALLNREDRREFIGSVTPDGPPERVARKIRQILGITLDDQRDCANWMDALRLFIERAESAGILVMVSGVVGSNTSRVLDPNEFRGFALADDLAPLVFINGADAKTAQMFTLAHEIAHLWLGESAVSDVSPSIVARNKIEQWCNRVAAEFLVPLQALESEITSDDPTDELAELAKTFKVSTLVILRRLLDAKRIHRHQFETTYAREFAKFTGKTKSSGGNFYNTLPVRVSKRFARALVGSTLEGQTLFRDAFQMLGISSEKTFREISKTVGYEE